MSDRVQAYCTHTSAAIPVTVDTATVALTGSIDAAYFNTPG